MTWVLDYTSWDFRPRSPTGVSLESWGPEAWCNMQPTWNEATRTATTADGVRLRVLTADEYKLLWSNHGEPGSKFPVGCWSTSMELIRTLSTDAFDAGVWPTHASKAGRRHFVNDDVDMITKDRRGILILEEDYLKLFPQSNEFGEVIP